MRGLVVAGLLAAGCTGSGEPLTFQSGTRLRAHVLVGEDGSRFAGGWVDSQLGFDCEMAMVDGRTRCAPADAAGLDYFADAACTQPAASVGVAPAYVFEQLEPECWSGPRVYYRPSEVRIGPVYAVSAEGCAVADPSNPYVVAGEPVAAATFVGVTEEIASGSERVQARLWRGDDGAWAMVGGYDREARIPVVPSYSTDTPTWQPEHLAYGFGDFGDASCTLKVGEMFQRCAPPKAIVSYEQVDGCWRERLFAVGETRLPGDPVYRVMEGMCTALSWVPPLSFELGAPLAPVEARSAMVGGRLRTKAVVAGDYALPTGEVIDSKWGEPCAPRTATDGRLRCLPGPGWAGHYADPDCQQRIAFVGWTEDCDPSTPTLANWREEGDRYRVFRLEAATITASMVYVRDGGACQAIDGNGSLFARAIDEVPPAEFVAVELMVE